MNLLHSFLRGSALGLSLLLMQACTRDIPVPSSTVAGQRANASSIAISETVLFERQNRPVANVSSAKGAHTRLKQECVDVYDVYYNKDTGEYVKEVYQGRKCTSGGDDPTGNNGGGGGEGVPPDPTGTGTSSAQSIKSQLPPCANTVLNNLLTSASQNGARENLLQSILNALQMPNSKMSVHFVTDNNMANNVPGDCRYNSSASYSTGVNDFTIRINSAYLSGGVHGSATDLFVAQVMLHEVLHAGLMDWYQTGGSAANGVNFDDLMAGFMAGQGLSPGDGQGQHDAMSLLVNQLGGALYSYYTSMDRSNSLGSQNLQVTSVQDCTYLCWTGLENTIGYQWADSHDSTFKLKCDAIHGAELTGNFAATGSQAAGTLQKRYPAGTDPCI